MKNQFTVRLSAVMLAIGFNCLFSPCPCVIQAGIPAMAAMQDVTETGAAELSAYPGIPDTEAARDAYAVCETAEACMSALHAAGNAGLNLADTGFVGSYEDARRVYEASKDLYLGDTPYSMDYERLADGNVRLLLKAEDGALARAYAEHLETEERLAKIAEALMAGGSYADTADRAFAWVTDHVTYAYTDAGECAGGYSTAYSAVMNGTATCDGLSTMLLALFDQCGVPAAKVQNSQHAYIIAWTKGQWMLYDAASGIAGDPGELMERYGDCYTPETVTLNRTAAGAGAQADY